MKRWSKCATFFCHNISEKQSVLIKISPNILLSPVLWNEGQPAQLLGFCWNFVLSGVPKAGRIPNKFQTKISGCLSLLSCGSACSGVLWNSPVTPQLFSSWIFGYSCSRSMCVLWMESLLCLLLCFLKEWWELRCENSFYLLMVLLERGFTQNGNFLTEAISLLCFLRASFYFYFFFPIPFGHPSLNYPVKTTDSSLNLQNLNLRWWISTSWTFKPQENGISSHSVLPFPLWYLDLSDLFWQVFVEPAAVRFGDVWGYLGLFVCSTGEDFSPGEAQGFKPCQENKSC